MELIRTLWQGLSAINDVTLYGPNYEMPRTSTISFTVKNFNSRTIAEKLAERAVFVSNGDFYATTVVEKLGLQNNGLVRAGCTCYTTSEEIERLIEGIKNIVR